ncbi:unnamed protein product [Staurois parvus]|uniref:Uncharacterized protein n=1 Tax=Staurois parvus TaxID=386267 RepID=A0ABN9EUQ8_9NEOB|nr:unnamed protein product [Staurois parvus]
MSCQSALVPGSTVFFYIHSSNLELRGRYSKACPKKVTEYINCFEAFLSLGKDTGAP